MQRGFTLYKSLCQAGIELVFLKEPHINTETYKKELNKQLELSINSGDKSPNELMNTIISALNKYILSLAQR